jgi:diguanylate cyclase (GGDEF)-like protein
MRPSFNYNKILLKSLTLCVSLLWIAGLGILDYSTGKRLSLLGFFLFPVFLATWYTGKKTGIVISFICAAVVSNSEIVSVVRCPHQVIPYWNLIIAFSLFLAVSLLLSNLKRAHLKASDLARTDSLTGVANRRAFFEIAGIELYRMNRYKRPFTIAYLELNDLKNMDETSGREAGDAFLRRIVDVLDANVRSSDLLARIDEGEFAILFTETNEDQAKSVIEKLCVSLREVLKNEKLELSYSIGVVTCIRPPATVNDILSKADHMMHMAKREGKNRVHYLVWRESAVVR